MGLLALLLRSRAAIASLGSVASLGAFSSLAAASWFAGGCASTASTPPVAPAPREALPTDPRLSSALVHERCGPDLPKGAPCGALHRGVPDDIELSLLRRSLCRAQTSEECRWNISVLLVLGLVDRYRYANFGLYASWCGERPEVCFELHELEQRVRVSHNRRVATLGERLKASEPLPPPPELEFHRKSILRLAEVMIAFVDLQPESTRWLNQSRPLAGDLVLSAHTP
jgi:hypothetical protein